MTIKNNEIGRELQQARCSIGADKLTKMSRIIRVLYPGSPITSNYLARYERGENMPPADKYKIILDSVATVQSLLSKLDLSEEDEYKRSRIHDILYTKKRAPNKNITGKKKGLISRAKKFFE